MKTLITKAKQVKGFTLIELLVVIAIIGILAAIVLVSLNDARTDARDTQRVGNLRNAQLQLEVYFDDNGQYPGFDDIGATGTPGTSCANAETGGSTNSLFATIGMGDITDPSANQNYKYGMNQEAATDYVLQAELEDANNMPQGSVTTDTFGCSCDQATEYCVQP